MEWLNYHHLLYFWTVAREGTIARASEELRLAQPTISGQIRVLEDQLGEKLFQRSGRNLVLTDMGRVVYRYADDIFSLGRELMDTLKDRPTGRPMRFQVGVADEVTKIIAYRLLEPAMRLPQPVQIVCRDGAPERLLTDLATHALDLVIADTPISPAIKVKAFSHPLGETPVTVFATREAGRAAPQDLSAIARRRAVPAADRRQDAAAHARSVFRAAGPPPAHRRRARRQRAADDVRPGGSGPVRGADACSRRK